MAEMDLSRETLIGVYRRMRTIRSFEENLQNLVAAGKIGGFMHLYIGRITIASPPSCSTTTAFFFTSPIRRMPTCG